MEAEQVGTEPTNDEAARQQDEAREQAIAERDAANQERADALANAGGHGGDAPAAEDVSAPDPDEADEPQDLAH